jgi:acyl-CoA synthetase (AMP-forming)/AMP-acid ligase II
MPEALAIVCGRGRRAKLCTFGELDADATALARGLIDLGVKPSMRLALLVPPGVEFVKLVFALLRSGAVTVLVDPGMGRRRVVDCLAATAPEGFIAVTRAQAVRTVLRRRFPQARINVTLGPRLFWGGLTYKQLLRRSAVTSDALPTTRPDEPAAIIFTSGSTGPPKGVLYTHRMFETQVAEIQRAYDIQAGGVDLACFALFGLFNSAMGVTTVFPDMNFSRPASAKPRKLLAAANQWQVTQAFASPAVWDKLSRHCEETGERIATLQKIYSCGAPVPAEVLRRTIDHVAAPHAQMHTPYGATEALPVSSIEASEVLSETAAKTAAGAGVCVGRKFDSINWRVIRITDEPIASLDDSEQLPAGEIGELVVRGPQVTPGYVVSNDDARNDPSFVIRHSSFSHSQGWHRMGDVGYFDSDKRFWYCGRKSQRVETASGTLFTECVEALFNRHPFIRRCALVGVGSDSCSTPVIVYETNLPRTVYPDPNVPGAPCTPSQLAARIREEFATIAAQHLPDANLRYFLRHTRLPVDVRHNAKINREALAEWAEKHLAPGH